MWCLTFLLWKTFTIKKQETDNKGSILVHVVSINDSEYILINFYNAGTENKQINVLTNMFVLLEEFDKN